MPLPLKVLFFLNLVLVSSFNFIASTASSISATAPVGVTEVEALLVWKASLDKESQSTLSSWVGTRPCTWIGIICGSFGSITHLNLSSSDLKGKLEGLNFSLFPNLTHVDLSINSLYGSIPSIGNLINLSVLYLYNNKLSGSIPQEIGLLRSLSSLALSNNNFTGPIPASIGNLTNLSVLNLYSNKLSGSIPQEIGLLRSLSSLTLSDNNFTGPIPASIGNLTNLSVLNLYYNKLSSSIPQTIGLLRSLSSLALSDNNFTGPIPASIGNLTNLSILYLYNNKLSGGHRHVYKVVMSSGPVVVVKKLHLSKDGVLTNVNAFQSEIVALTNIRYRNIVKLYDFHPHAKHSFLAYEFIEKGSLRV
ncbi:Leucine-rich repeat receptor-like protein kinase family protein [Theobroma cacao]|uniref:Leucine-rich repeat receptor-like protein kinase family protein n=1 Tax=Theobroma cacao TaxID=3641 RepID=A0A061DLE4_THECC|nr:Leucine-rich repeat receptor-like protein kinase family protein [Theobroma cacao]